MAMNTFWRLLHGCSVTAFAKLLMLENYAPNIFCYNPSLNSVDCDISLGLPWPVVLYYGAHSLKHIFVKTKRFAQKPFADALTRFHYRFVQRASSSFGARPWWRIPTKVLGTLPRCEPEISSFSNDLHRAFLRLPLGRLRASERSANWCAAYDFALEFVKQHNFSVVPADKGGGVVLVEKNSLQDLISSKFNHNWYRFVNPLTLQQINGYNGAMFRALKFAEEEKLEIEGFAKYYMYTTRVSSGDFASPIMANVKTHKGPGDVSVRLLHASQLHPYRFIEKFAVKPLKQILALQSHLFFSADKMLDEIQRLRLPHDVKFWRFDVEDFFMNGEPTFLAEKCTEGITDRVVQNAHRRLFTELLTQQYVTQNGCTYFVASGSGMGRPMSGDVANCALLQLAEVGGHISTASLRRHGIHFFGRYFDDIIVFECPSERTEGYSIFTFIEKYRRRMVPYKLKAEECSNHELRVLDAVIFKGRRFEETGHVSFRPHQPKDRARISGDSCHAPSVLRCWPKSEAVRLMKRSSAREFFNTAKTIFMNDLIASLVSTASVEEVNDIRFRQYEKRPSLCTDHVYWLVLPFHPALARCRFAHVAKRIVERWSEPLKNVLGFIPEIRVSWRNAQPSISKVMRKLHTF